MMMSVNVRIAFNAIRAALDPMLKSKRGRIVAIGSRAAVEPSPNLAAYAVSKAALVALVKNVAAEVKDSGITANVGSAQHHRYAGQSQGDAASRFFATGWRRNRSRNYWCGCAPMKPPTSTAQ